VHITSLSNDYYHFDANKHTLTGERSHQTYRLGDKVRVKVVRVDLDEKKIDFEMLSEGTYTKPGKRQGSSKKSVKKTSASTGKKKTGKKKTPRKRQSKTGSKRGSRR
jgi:ribonuclease R